MARLEGVSASDKYEADWMREESERQGEAPKDREKILDAIDLLDQLGPNPNVYELPTGTDFKPYAEAAETILTAFREGDADVMKRQDLKKIANEISTAASMMSGETA